LSTGSSLNSLLTPKNPRRHSDAQIAQIAGSIAQFGFNSPILIDAKGCIIAGHGRYLGALKLGLETVPVIVLDHLTEIEKQAYLLADDKLAELSDWDDDTLASELAELKNADIAQSRGVPLDQAMSPKQRKGR
jgi:ParB-like chromosome segregation protein Spo0J